MVVVTTTYEAELALDNSNNMFKALGGMIFAAALTVAIPPAFTSAATADLIQLDPTMWQRLGFITKRDGITFARNINTDTEESWGVNEPTRTDITGDITSAAFTLQETTRYALEMYDFCDLTTVTPDATTGEVAYSKPATAVPMYRRMIFMGVDGAGTTRRYRFKIMPRAQLTAVRDEVWNNTSATAYPLTVTATTDPTLGYSVRNVLAGPGQKALNTAGHFGVASP